MNNIIRVDWNTIPTPIVDPVGLQVTCPLVLTNGGCESTDVIDIDVLHSMGLETGVVTEEKIPFPLTERENLFIAEDSIDLAFTYILLGYTVVYQGKKWLSPIIEYMFSEDDSNGITSAQAEALMEVEAQVIASRLIALGGYVMIEKGVWPVHHCLTMMIPFDCPELTKFESSFDEYVNWLTDLVTPTSDEYDKYYVESGTVAPFVAQIEANLAV